MHDIAKKQHGGLTGKTPISGFLACKATPESALNKGVKLAQNDVGTITLPPSLYQSRGKAGGSAGDSVGALAVAGAVTSSFAPFYDSGGVRSLAAARALVVGHFDRLASTATLAGFPALALGMTAKRFGMSLGAVRGLVVAARNAEAMTNARQTTFNDMKNQITTRTVGPTTYVNHGVDSLEDARRLADQICLQSMLPVYFGTGFAVDRPHIVRLDYGSELVLRFFPNGEDRSGSADDYTTVHSFAVTARVWPTEKELLAEAAALEAAR